MIVLVQSCKVNTYQNSPKKNSTKVKNVILLIGDGMGLSQIQAALFKSRDKLNMLNCDAIGLMKTPTIDGKIADSAASGTAMATGKKTESGYIGELPDGVKPKNIIEFLEDKNYATGLVSTSAITDATPASFVAHQPCRGFYEEIANDIANSGLDVIIGGGKKHFTHRRDAVNLIDIFEIKGFSVTYDLKSTLKTEKPKLLALLADEHLPKKSEGRKNMLSKTTTKAIELLAKNEKGFFLMVEGAQIDWAGHENDADYLCNEVIDFDKAVGAALKFMRSNPNTLVIVTSDHETGGMIVKDGNYSTGKYSAIFTTRRHTPLMVPVFAFGPQSENFIGVYNNTDIFKKLKNIYGF
jgi:alkaline phosphatase